MSNILDKHLSPRDNKIQTWLQVILVIIIPLTCWYSYIKTKNVGLAVVFNIIFIVAYFIISTSLAYLPDMLYGNDSNLIEKICPLLYQKISTDEKGNQTWGFVPQCSNDIYKYNLEIDRKVSEKSNLENSLIIIPLLGIISWRGLNLILVIIFCTKWNMKI